MNFVETVKLYYEDARQASFEATVQACEEAENGWDIILDRTAFYPEGGGQPSDQGTIDRWEVLDVQERDGVILHRLETPMLPGTKVSGRVDMARRFDYMQQHSADHILTGVIHRRYGFDNVGFHMGQESTFIDLDGMLDDSELMEMERVANEVVWMDLPVEVSWPDADTLRTMAYRSKKALDGAVRIVTVPGIDVCACCGTHVRRTGEVGTIKIISSTKVRGGVRIEYVAGRRAYAYFNEVQLQNRMVSVSLSAKQLRTAEAVRRLLEERDALQARAVKLEQEHFSNLAEQLRGSGDALVFEENLSTENIRRLADAIKETCGGKAMVFSGNDAAGYQYAIAVKEGDVRADVKAMNEALNGRGGGRDANFVQGSVKAVRSEIEVYIQG